MADGGKSYNGQCWPQVGERGDRGPGGQRRPRPQQGQEAARGRRPRGTAAARAGGEAARGPGRTRGRAPVLLTPESWRCEELRATRSGWLGGGVTRFL